MPKPSATMRVAFSSWLARTRARCLLSNFFLCRLARAARDDDARRCRRRRRRRFVEDDGDRRRFWALARRFLDPLSVGPSSSSSSRLLLLSRAEADRRSFFAAVESSSGPKRSLLTTWDTLKRAKVRATRSAAATWRASAMCRPGAKWKFPDTAGKRTSPSTAQPSPSCWSSPWGDSSRAVPSVRHCLTVAARKVQPFFR
mmetsp:Transcript_18605/g.74281  ORF Transcript_18605/g.74281 Transcript_18605/m.74281 type:complete len:200 (+) Transcript_18605:713-1312(+)